MALCQDGVMSVNVVVNGEMSGVERTADRWEGIGQAATGPQSTFCRLLQLLKRAGIF